MQSFLSSTIIDLKRHRQTAAESLERLGLQVVRMERFGARPEEPQKACLEEVRNCDLFIGIYAHRYGLIPQGHSLSITEQEFDEAQRLKKPIFGFVVADDYAWPPSMIEMEEPHRTQLARFKEKIDNLTTRQTFTDPIELAYQIATSVGFHLQRVQYDPVRHGTDNPYSILLGSDNLTELVDIAVSALHDATRTDYNQLFLLGRVDDGFRPIEVAYVIPPHKRRYRIASLDGLIGSVFQNGRLRNAKVVRELPDYLQAVIDTRAELIVPIAVGGVVVGIFNSESEIENYYTQDMCTKASQLAEAFGHALARTGWRLGTPFSELPHVCRSPEEMGQADV